MGCEMKFYQVIREKRRALGMTSEEVAKAIGVTRVSVSMYENATCSPTLENAIKLSKLLKFSLDELDSGSPDEFDRKQVKKKRIEQKIKRMREDLDKLENEHDLFD